MAMLGLGDYCSIMDVLAALRDARSREEIIQIALHRVAKVVGSEATGYNEIGPTGATSNYLDPVELDASLINRGLEHFGHEHPIILDFHATQRPGTRRISDFISQRQLHNLGLYCEMFRPLDIEFQMTLVLPVCRGVARGLAFNRQTSDFTERDRGILDILMPHVVGALESARLCELLRAKLVRGNDMLESLPEGVVVLRDSRRMERTTPKALGLLARYFPGEARAAATLPDEIARWVRQQLSPGEDLAGRTLVLVKEVNGCRLMVRLVCWHDGGRLLLLSETGGGPSARALLAMGLSARQAEVLLALAQGRTNLQIAKELHISLHTVRRHVEAIFKVLGVCTRTQACRMAWEKLQHGDR